MHSELSNIICKNNSSGHLFPHVPPTKSQNKFGKRIETIQDDDDFKIKKNLSVKFLTKPSPFMSNKKKKENGFQIGNMTEHIKHDETNDGKNKNMVQELVKSLRQELQIKNDVISNLQREQKQGQK